MEFFYLPDGISNLVAISMIVLSFFTSFLSAAFSIGGGIVMLAVLSPLLPTSSLIPVHGIIQLGSNFGRAILLFKYIKRDTILPYAIGSIVGSFLGASIFTNIPEQYIKLAIGLFIIFSVFGKLPKVKNGYLWLAGFVVSFGNATGCIWFAYGIICQKYEIEPN